MNDAPRTTGARAYLPWIIAAVAVAALAVNLLWDRSEPAGDATIAELAEKLPHLQLINAYGATETTSPATLTPPGLGTRMLDTVGRVVPCGEIRVVDESGTQVPPGTPARVRTSLSLVRAVPSYAPVSAAAPPPRRERRRQQVRALRCLGSDAAITNRIRPHPRWLLHRGLHGAGRTRGTGHQGA